MDAEMHERFARGEEQIKELDRRFEEHKVEEDKRFSKVEDMHDLIYRLGTNVEVLGTNVNNKLDAMDTKITKVETKVDKMETKYTELENKPAKNSLKVWQTIGKKALDVIVGAVVGAVLVLIGLGG